jgi:hypothetical protein
VPQLVGEALSWMRKEKKLLFRHAWTRTLYVSCVHHADGAKGEVVVLVVSEWLWCVNALSLVQM